MASMDRTRRLPSAALAALLVTLADAPAHPSLYDQAEIDLTTPRLLRVHTVLHAPDLVPVDPAHNAPGWFAGLPSAERTRLLARAKKRLPSVFRGETARGPLHRIAPARPDAVPPAPDNTIRLVQSLPQPGGELRVLVPETAAKRLLVTVSRPGQFPEVHDLAPGQSRAIALPPPLPPPPRTPLPPWAWAGLALLLALGLARFRKRLPVLAVAAAGLAAASAKADDALALRVPALVVEDHVFLTHARRDLVEAVRPSLAPGSGLVLVAPEASRADLEQAEASWEAWWTKRFDSYLQQVTKRPVRSLPAQRWVRDGDTFSFPGRTVRVLATPGYTRDAVSYLVEEAGGRRVAYTGDLLLAGGRVPDLYSFQDEIPEAKIGAYHGYGARFAPWIASLERLRDEAPDALVPARGPEIADPGADIARALERVRALYASYLRTNALHWYFGEERMNACATRVLGPGHGIRSMPLAEHVDLPPWCRHLGTTKLLVSDSGHGFVLDVGGPKPLEELQRFLAEGLLRGIEGIFVTHLHNDHTAAVRDAQRAFACPVHATPEVAPVLAAPGGWFLPGLSPNAVDSVTTQADEATLAWREFRFTFLEFPGQMLHHGALRVERPGHPPVLFVGDSFSPSGMDDYCMMNRNLSRPGAGYEACFDRLLALPAGSWIVNQHIPHLFRFTPAEVEFLRRGHRERRALAAALTPWDDPDYALDEGWAVFEPYGQEVRPGTSATAGIRLWNHSPREREFTLRLHASTSTSTSGIPEEPVRIRIPARGNALATFPLSLPPDLAPGILVLTADVASAPDISFPHGCEGLLRILPPP
jgi:glyoxylase-like metal-dependent hydrolase (beta-lactamase superfamily II)